MSLDNRINLKETESFSNNDPTIGKSSLECM